MSILIKGIEMPKSCWDCEFCRDGLDEYAEHYDYCVALDMNILISQTERHENCPLVKVPTPHSDLIDREALIKALHAWFDDDEVHAFEKDAYWHHGVVMKIINDALTIIESEDECG